MKLILDVNDAKAPFVLELLSNLNYVKTKTLTPYKATVLGSIIEAVDEMYLIKKGKLKARNVTELLNEL